jgi:hypothetical protein
MNFYICRDLYDEMNLATRRNIEASCVSFILWEFWHKMLDNIDKIHKLADIIIDDDFPRFKYLMEEYCNWDPPEEINRYRKYDSFEIVDSYQQNYLYDELDPKDELDLKKSNQLPLLTIKIIEANRNKVLHKILLLIQRMWEELGRCYYFNLELNDDYEYDIENNIEQLCNGSTNILFLANGEYDEKILLILKDLQIEYCIEVNTGDLFLVFEENFINLPTLTASDFTEKESVKFQVWETLDKLSKDEK